jgi:periplasmic divalent cation tolerance protein
VRRGRHHAESAEWLADFTRSVVEDRLVACGHNIAQMRAIYCWKGKIYHEIVARANRDHADNVPCVIAVPIHSGHQSYLHWIYTETAPEVSSRTEER